MRFADRFAGWAGFAPSVAAALALAAAVFVLHTERRSFREAVETWAVRDLRARTELAADALAPAAATGDFRRIRAFGEECRADGTRLTVLSAAGGVVFDSAAAAFGSHSRRPEVDAARRLGAGAALRRSSTTHADMLYCARRAGDFIVRLAIPRARVHAPFHRARTGLILSCAAGAAAVLLVFLFTNRLLARLRALTRERDETERQLAALRRAEAFRRDFIANLAHELKTPLTGILGAADLLDGAATDADRATLLTLLRGETVRLDALARDILSLAKLEHDTEADARRDFAPADLADLLRTVRDRFTPQAAAAHTRLSVAAPSAPVVCTCNARLVEQAVANLVANALRHSRSPSVDLTVARDGDRAVLSVIDHGDGIPPTHRARVFERFYRVDAAHTRGGTGLGLAIVKHIARLHGGEAALAETPGGGCTFTLALPSPQS